MTLRLISNTRASEPGTITSLTASLGTLTYRVSPGLALVGLKVILFTVRSALIAPRTFFECEGSRLGGTAMVYNVFSKLMCILVMAEGGWDPMDETTDKDPPIQKRGMIMMMMMMIPGRKSTGRHPYPPNQSQTEHNPLNQPVVVSQYL